MKQDFELNRALAFHRFGWGRRFDQRPLAEGSPTQLTGRLLDDAEKSSTYTFDDLPSSREALSTWFDFRREIKAIRARKEETNVEKPKNPARWFLLGELEARFDTDRKSEIGFGERLVDFWSNHFAVSANNPRLAVLAGPYRREAVRPHITGRFEDLLLSATRHPAMIHYLDNQLSMGPNSKAGQRRNRGLNENLAREILELHTVGVNGGYTQQDVTNFAKVLTGWTIVGPKARGGTIGTFIFRKFMHEPGAQKIMGKVYDQQDMEQGIAVLRTLAYHPSTARFVSQKLVQHFVSDDPPDSLVARVEKTFLNTGGDLRRMYEALLQDADSWRPELKKFRRPYEFVVATSRALNVRPKRKNLFGSLKLMGQQPFRPPSPQGWPDVSESWIAPDALKTRLDWAEQVARSRPSRDVRELARDVLGPLLSEETDLAIARAESAKQAMALMMLSPEFQRR